MNGKTFHILYILDNNYWLPVAVSARSAIMAESAAEGNGIVFDLIVEDVLASNLEVLARCLTTRISTVRFHKFDRETYRDLPSYHGTKLVWVRLKLAECFQGVDDWMCVCDGDTLWQKSPSQLWGEILKRDDGNVILIGSDNCLSHGDSYERHLADLGFYVKRKDYVCMGFAAIHIGRLRNSGIQEFAKSFLQKHSMPPYLEQDIFNCMFCDDRKAILPAIWGVQPISGLNRIQWEDVGVVHFYGSLPWPIKWSRRLMDVHVVWWSLLNMLDLRGADGLFRFRRWQYLVARSLAWLFEWMPRRVRRMLHREVLGVHLPLRKIVREFRRRDLEVRSYEETR